MADLAKDSFYKTLTPEQSKAAFRSEHDFDAPESIDFDILVDRLRDLKAGYSSTMYSVREAWLTCSQQAR